MRAERFGLTRNKCIGQDITDPTPWEKNDEGGEICRCPICEKAVYAGDRICVTEDGSFSLHESCAVYRRNDMTVSEILDRLGMELYSGVAGEK